MRAAALPSLPTPRLAAVLCSGPFAAGLVTLVANDHWLKRAYPGAITGKLSDFAGLGVVGLLLAAAFPRHRTWTLLALAALFAAWKSELSQPVIDFVSAATGFSFGRTVDGSDVVAAAILPLCGPVADRSWRAFNGWRTARRMLAVPCGVAAALAIMATSLVETRHEFSVRPLDGNAALDPARLAGVIDQVAGEHGLQVLTRTAEGATYSGNGMTLAYRRDASSRVRFEASATANGPFFGTPGYKRADELREAVKRSLAHEFPGLEYAEPLRPQPAPRAPCNPSPVPSCR